MDIKNTFCVYTTIIEMLKDRNYNINKINTFDEFSVMYEENNFNIIDEDKKIYVNFHNDVKSFSKKDLENIVSHIKEKYGNINIIIVIKTKPNIIIDKEILNDVYKNVELFLFKNLTFNITRHVDMPTHIPLSAEEISEVLDKYKTNKNQFPKMLESDPVARYYGIKSGGMFKIIRKSQSSGEYITYRYVK